jgi:probable Rubsico expression protein CbbX
VRAGPTVHGSGDGTAPRRGFAMPGAAAPPSGGAAAPAADHGGPPPPLPDDAVVDLAAERSAAGVDEVLAALDAELVGLAPVKARIAEIAALLLVDRTRARFGITTTPPNLHMCFTGGPGTGKTTVALRMAGLLHRLGYLRRGHLVTATRDDLVGQYVGHTAPKTRDVLKRAMGGVLFIDEAYYLHKAENERDYGSESIEILLQVMENHRDDVVVILAGYAAEMDGFFRSNPGMSSRIAHHIAFPDYTADELEQIAHRMAGELGYAFAPDAVPALRDYLRRRMARPRFANARSVRNAVERARLRQARRLVDGPDPRVGRGAVTTIEAADLLASRVFDAEPGADDPGGRTTAAPGGSGTMPV